MYRECPRCGAALDPGEQCDCELLNRDILMDERGENDE